jgi:hypothetical protein
MLAPLLALLVCTGQDIKHTDRPYLPQLFPVRDPRNGYEDYIQAVDLENALRGPEGSDRLSRSLDYNFAPAERVRRERLRVAKYGKPLMLVARGNSKAVHDPRKRLVAATLFPEFASFRELARLLGDKADIEFRDGQPRQGMDDLLQIFAFGRKVQRDPVLIGFLVGVAIQGIGTRVARSHWNQMDSADARRLERIVDPSIVQVRDAAAYSVVSDFSNMHRYVDDMIMGRIPRDLLGEPYGDTFAHAFQTMVALASGDSNPPDVSVLSARLTSMKREERLRHFQASNAYLLSFIAWVPRTFSSPESAWGTVAVPRSRDPVVSQLNDLLLPAYSPTFRAVATMRGRYRLMNLAAQVVEFRDRTGRLPASLSAMQVSAFDPLSGKRLVYERLPDGFQVYSRGSKATGVVGLGRKWSEVTRPQAPPGGQPR